MMIYDTWFKPIALKGKQELINLLRQFINNDAHISESNKEWYQYAIDKELITPIRNLIYDYSDGKLLNDRDTCEEEWVMYNWLQTYPRYPLELRKCDKPIIRSYSAMFDFIKVNGGGCEKNLDCLDTVFTFFVNNPGGIIVIG